MTRWIRAVLIFYSLLLAVVSLLFFFMMLSENVLNGMITILLQFAVKKSGRSVIGIAAILLFLGSLISLSYSIMSGRLRKARVRSTDIGDIDIGVDAIESIALNAAKAAQSGIRTAKARVLPFKGGRISVRLSAMVYPDVELAPMMSRVQERVKKDVERYTGIEVGNVEIKINRVEAINVRVER